MTAPAAPTERQPQNPNSTWARAMETLAGLEEVALARPHDPLIHAALRVARQQAEAAARRLPDGGARPRPSPDPASSALA